MLTSEGALNGDGADFTQWTPISVAYGVTVVLDGDNKKISGLYINDSDAGTGSSVGLFGVSSGTLTVSNLSLVDSYIMGYQNVGSLVGSSAGPLTVKNVLNSASVAATLINAGGLVGNTGSSETYIESSGNLGSVASLGTSVGDYPGASPAGFIACAIGGQVTITKSFNKGAVSGFNNNAGGFVGYADGVTISITQSYNEGLVSGTWGAGGLLGSVYSSDEDDVVTLANVYNTADVNGTGAVAGLVGDMNGFKGKALSITNSYSPDWPSRADKIVIFCSVCHNMSAEISYISAHGSSN